MTTFRPRPLTIGVFTALLAVAVGFSALGRHVVREDSKRLLRNQAGEISALLTNSFSGVNASLRSLQSVADGSDPTSRAFVQSAEPLVVGQTRAIMLVWQDGATARRVALVGDGVPDGELAGSRAALVQRAMREPGLVTGVISDGVRRRIGLARGPWPRTTGWVVYQESAIDPNNPDQPTNGRPFRDLDVAVYASSRPHADHLVLATTRRVPLADPHASVSVAVGVDQWLVVVHSPRPLVGSFATMVPWLLLLGGLGTALLAGAVVETISRRRDFALDLVEERTAALRETVDELQAAQSELVRHAFSDELTGLANRALFLDRLGNALARSARGRMPPVVMFIDLDRFKWVNDSLGHEIGDELLVAVAARLAGAVRPGDTIARLGGDEFVVLCDSPADQAEVWAIAARLRRCLTTPFGLGGREIHVTMSIGLAMAQGGCALKAEDLLRDADLAMYRAKELGRDRVEIFDEPLRHSAALRLERETALRHAIDAREFSVYYQPLVSLTSGVVVGVEALVRWIRADGTVVYPDEFITLAEETGLIGAIGVQVLEDACNQVASWNRARSAQRSLRLSVNLSTRQLTGDELPGLVAANLHDSKLDPALLYLEITESTLMEGENARRALDTLKALGVTLVVDDFGTGYSSLLYLRRFPVDVLKVDKSFVAGLGDSPEDTAIVTGVLRLAQALDLRTVAEGVETAAQLDGLTALGCEFGQGYYWSRPLPADRFATWLVEFETSPAFAEWSS